MNYLNSSLVNNYKRTKMNYRSYGALAPLGRRGVVAKGTKLWPGGVVPYDISNINRKYKTVII